MTQFRQIEIDFDVHQRIELERKGFSDTDNDVLRRLLLGKDSPPRKPEVVSAGRAWSGKGVTLPHGTQLRMEYNGVTYKGEIQEGVWVVEGKRLNSPSAAAGSVARTKNGTRPSLDGWFYWQVKRPGDNDWMGIGRLRK